MIRRPMFAAVATIFLIDAASAFDQADRVDFERSARINSIAVPCDIRQADFTINARMQEAAKTDDELASFVAKVHRQTQAEYAKARDAGNKNSFCDGILKRYPNFAIPWKRNRSP